MKIFAHCAMAYAACCVTTFSAWAENEPAPNRVRLLMEAADSTDPVTPARARASILARVGLAQAHAGDKDGSRHTLDRLLDLVPGIFHDPDPATARDRAILLGDIAQIQAIVDGTERARRTFDQASDASVLPADSSSRADVLRSIAVAELGAGFEAASRRRLLEAATAANQIESHTQRGHTLNTIAVAQARAGDVDAAVRTAHATTSEGYAAWAIPTIAQALADKDETDQARSLLDAYRLTAYSYNRLFRTQALIEIASTEIQIGDLDAARLTIEVVIVAIDHEQNPAYRVALLCKTAVIKHKVGGIEAAQAMLDAARRTCRTITHTRDQAFKWIEIARAFSDIGDKASASAALGEALAATENAEPASHRGFLLGKIAEAQATCSTPNAALKTIADPRVQGRPKIEALIALAATMIQTMD